MLVETQTTQVEFKSQPQAKVSKYLAQHLTLSHKIGTKVSVVEGHCFKEDMDNIFKTNSSRLLFCKAEVLDKEEARLISSGTIYTSINEPFYFDWCVIFINLNSIESELSN